MTLKSDLRKFGFVRLYTDDEKLQIEIVRSASDDYYLGYMKSKNRKGWYESDKGTLPPPVNEVVKDADALRLVEEYREQEKKRKGKV